MNRLNLPATALLIFAVAAAGCSPPATVEEGGVFTITLHASVDEEGRPTFGVEHDDIAVFPGERVRWECDCPGIDSFAVEDLRHLASIDELVDLYLEVEQRGGPESLRGASARLGEALAAGGDGEDDAAERRRALALLTDSYDSLVAALAATVEDDPGEAFESPVPEELVPADGYIESGPYRDIDGNHVWKFTWVIQKGELVERWDPHFSGHRRR